jgi:hypothetical protein
VVVWRGEFLVRCKPKIFQGYAGAAYFDKRFRTSGECVQSYQLFVLILGSTGKMEPKLIFDEDSTCVVAIQGAKTPKGKGVREGAGRCKIDIVFFK